MDRFDPFERLPRRRAALQSAGSALLLFLVLGFALHASTLGIHGLFAPGSLESRFVHPGMPVTSAGLFLHMALGGAVTLLLPFQLLGPVRRRWSHVHKATGYAIATGAGVAATAGLVYIARAGTLGAAEMNAGFALYGALMLVAAVLAVFHARARSWSAHRAWALRLGVLILASWAYRLHYVLWYLATGGLWSDTETHLGAFDRVQNWAFYLPYLVVLEIWLRRRRSAARAT